VTNKLCVGLLVVEKPRGYAKKYDQTWQWARTLWI
jgi:hypothetical protein